MKRLKKLLLIPITMIVLAIGAVIFMASPLFAVENAYSSITLEAGKKPNLTPDLFLKGADWCVNLSVVDTSSVDYRTVGEYPVYIYHGLEKYTTTITITDTTAPTLTCNVKNITVEKGDYITVNTIGMKATDNTGVERLLFQHIVAEKIQVEGNPEDAVYIENLFIKGRDLWAQSYTLEHGGIYTLTVAAIDAYNNTTYLSLNVTVEEPPVLEAETDIYLAVGKNIDYTDYITAWDFLDPEYGVNDVKIDSSDVDIANAGTYEVLYTARDDYGLETYAATKVHVYPAADLQELINTHAINMNEHVIIGATNIYDSGYYTENNPELIQDVMEPAMIHIENSYNDTFGSGYILKIDENFVTIATNQHVITGDLTPQIVFHDGTYKYAAVVAADPREDIAFLRIPISDDDNEACVTPEYVKTLRTVHINKSYWVALDNELPINLCYTSIDIDGEVWTEAVGYLVYKEATRTWNEYEDINECIISMEPVAGTSGSAIFDGHGYLIAMVRGFTTYDTADGESYQETVAVPLGEILDYYEMIFHERLHYQ